MFAVFRGFLTHVRVKILIFLYCRSEPNGWISRQTNHSYRSVQINNYIVNQYWTVLTSMIIVPSRKLGPFTSTLWCSLGEWMRYKPCHYANYEVMTPSNLQNGVQISSTRSNHVAWVIKKFSYQNACKRPIILTAGFRLAASPTGNESEGTL